MTVSGPIFGRRRAEALGRGDRAQLAALTLKKNAIGLGSRRRLRRLEGRERELDRLRHQSFDSRCEKLGHARCAEVQLFEIAERRALEGT